MAFVDGPQRLYRGSGLGSRWGGWAGTAEEGPVAAALLPARCVQSCSHSLSVDVARTLSFCHGASFQFTEREARLFIEH